MRDTPDRVFLSYAHEDLEAATQLYEALIAEGVSVWFDKAELVGGNAWGFKTHQAIQRSSRFLALLSSRSVPKVGEFQKELAAAFTEQDKRPPGQDFVVPVRLDDCQPLHPRFHELHWINLFPSWEAGVADLLRALPNRGGESATAIPQLRPKPSGPVTPALARFEQYFQSWRARTRTLSHIPPEETADIRTPKFLLYDRAGSIVLAIVDGFLNTSQLQKSHETQTDAKPVPPEQAAKLGFVDCQVHPFFLNDKHTIARILIDAVLLAQVVRHPESLIALPLYGPGQAQRYLIVGIQHFFDALFTVNRENCEILFANIAAPGTWPDPLLSRLMQRAQRITTRFAPTPSNTLHIGNARTALISYLFALQHRGRASFHIRIDDTNDLHRDPAVVEALTSELSWLGLHWDSCFKQSDARSRSTYEGFGIMLELAGVIESEGNVSRLSQVPPEGYYNVWLDWRLGPQVRHSYPRDKDRQPKEIALTNRSREAPYYRFAGLVDDLILSTHIFRDEGQMHLTEVQAHIRYFLEHFRQHGEQILRDKGLDPERSLPLPVYVHVPFVRSAERKGKLSKRAEERPYMLCHMRDLQKLFPEAVVAWIVATIVPPPARGASWHAHLDEIARCIAEINDLEIALSYFADRFTLDDVSQSLDPIVCNLRDLRRAQRVVIRHLPPLTLQSRLEGWLPPGTRVPDGLVYYVRSHHGAFADVDQILALLNPQASGEWLRDSTREILVRLFGSTPTSQAFVQALRDEIAELRRYRSARGRLAVFLGDLRWILTGCESSPKIEVILSALEPDRVFERLNRSVRGDVR